MESNYERKRVKYAMYEIKWGYLSILRFGIFSHCLLNFFEVQ